MFGFLRSLVARAAGASGAAAAPADRYPVLLVHGIWDSGAAFKRMARHLRREGHEIHTIDLAPNDGRVGIDKLAEQIAAYVDRHLPPGAPLDLVGFSMGGLVSRYYVQRLGGIERVRRFISISAPHHGTALAHVLSHPGYVQMRPNSRFLQDLNRDVGMLARLQVTSIWSPLDLTIVPARSSRLPVGVEVLVPCPLHGLMLADPRCHRAVTVSLRRGLAPS